MPKLYRQEYFYGLLSRREINEVAESVARELTLWEEATPDNLEGRLGTAIDKVGGEFLENWRGALPNWEDNYVRFLLELDDLIRPVVISKWKAYNEGKLDL